MGNLTVDAASGQRSVTLDGRTYAAHVYNQGLTEASQAAVPLRGFVLDGEAVLNSAPAVKVVAAQGAVPHTLYGNDLFAGALELDGNAGVVSDNNIGATKEFGEPNHAGNAGGASVWYSFTALSSGPVTIYTDDGFGGTALDTLLAVYTGSSVDALTEQASDDDANGGLNSEVNFYVEAGVTYSIAVDGYRYSGVAWQGSYTLT